jgi:hypothetical protein
MLPELYLYTKPADERNSRADKARLRAQAQRLFSTMAANGKVHRVIQTLKRRPGRLLDRATLQCTPGVLNQHYAGQMSVPLDRMRGSEGRTEDFDDNFYPLHDRMRSRWLNVASMRLAGDGLPAVELIHTSGIYFVRDGHHRISVAKALGEAYIDAEVTEVTC